MVSQYTPSAGDGQQLALRGAASVVGVPSTSHHRRDRDDTYSSSRARRYNRSHAGGSSFAPQNEFPIFSNTGDVEIIVRVPSGHENRYLLHRHILTRCSGFFEASTSSEWSRAQQIPELPAPGAGRESRESERGNGDELARVEEHKESVFGAVGFGQGKKRWRYELDWGSGQNDVPMLVQKDPGESSGLPATNNSLFGDGRGSSSAQHSSSRHSHRKSNSHSFFRSVANLTLSATHHAPALPPPTPEEQDLLRDYDNLFRIMYNYPPVLDGVNIADAYVQCKSLLTLADQYDALSVVGPRVDHHLLQFQSRLWKQIAKYPISYLRLGYMARSKVIFQEALIHVVGQWPAGERSIRAALPESVVDIIEDKVDELEETVSRIEARLFRLTLTTRTGEKVTPATSYIDWLAVSLFRQWLAENTTPPPVPSAVGGSGRSSAAGVNGNGSRAREQSRTRGRGGSTSSSGGSSHGRSSRARQHGSGGGDRNGEDSDSPPPPVSPLATLGRTYRLLGQPPDKSGRDGFLGHDECKRFLKLTPELYTRDNLRKFEKRIEELKAMAREIVRPLMGSGLELDMCGQGGGAGLGYLTCTTLRERELPWKGDEYR
ncbi:uncharacterized protein CTHT_0007340 [Thermochaetoides thermophila DSM 1495]|uniref:BTB domain-containing protein n=1 Tax=Chaetomium thermophilum (strain DSM 1495 / CBS 144.50 / IMI 039719) TaxID=759272 RepID=G0RYN7_CHATD|nr:hypothetical protein CTHT_0007340 [Thermochaetoides thermophila DSM 1495]EGS24023.1 hypothetical protein CTHT_0007340 [Thermochaetoides thermophila DSM 1495]